MRDCSLGGVVPASLPETRNSRATANGRRVCSPAFSSTPFAVRSLAPPATTLRPDCSVRGSKILP